MAHESEKRVACTLFLIALLTYALSATFGFTFDDSRQILENPLVVSNVDLLKIFLTPAWPGDLYRPLTVLSFRLTYALFGPDPLPFHITNILLHALVVVALFKTLRLRFDPNLSAIAALLFALHPIHSEAVLNIWNRSELLAALFGLCALWAAGSGKLIFSVVSFALALLSKESAIVFLPLVAIYFWKDRKTLALSINALIALAFVTARSAIVTAADPESIDNVLRTLPALERIQTAWSLLGKYLALLVYPYPLHADYSFVEPGRGTLWATAFLLLTLFWTIRRSSLALWGWWFFIAFAVTSNILFPIGTVFAERLAYVPSIAACGLIAHILTQFPVKRIGILCAIPLSIIYFLITSDRAPVWHDDLTLWRIEAAQQPLNAKVQHLYAYQLFIDGNYTQAIDYEQRALAVAPEFVPSMMLLQRSFQRIARYESAAKILRQVVTLRPAYAPAYDALGWASLETNQLDAARKNFADALSFSPEYQASHLGQFALALKEGNLEKARMLEQQLDSKARKDPRYARYSATYYK